VEQGERGVNPVQNLRSLGETKGESNSEARGIDPTGGGVLNMWSFNQPQRSRREKSGKTFDSGDGGEKGVWQEGLFDQTWGGKICVRGRKIPPRRRNSLSERSRGRKEDRR